MNNPKRPFNLSDSLISHAILFLPSGELLGPFRWLCMRGDEEVIGFAIAKETGDIFSAGRFPPAVYQQRSDQLTEWRFSVW